MRRRSRLAISLLPLLVSPIAASLEALQDPRPECDPSLRATEPDIGYRPRSGRCEGLYVSEISASALEVVSLTNGPLRYDLGPGAETLAVRVYDVADGGPPIRLRAMGRQPRTYYRMDALFLPGESLFAWAKDVLARLDLQPDRIGLFAFKLDAAGDTVYVPVGVGEPPPDDRFELIVRTTVDADGVVYRCRQDGGSASACRCTAEDGAAGLCEMVGDWNQLTLPGGRIPAGEPIVVKVPMRPGLMDVDIAVMPRDSAAYRPPLTVAISSRRPG